MSFIRKCSLVAFYIYPVQSGILIIFFNLIDKQKTPT